MAETVPDVRDKPVRIPILSPFGDRAIRVDFDPGASAPSLDVNQRARAFASAVERAGIAGITGAIPAFATVAVRYEPNVIEADAVVDALRVIVSQVKPALAKPARVVEIPVVYGGDAGPDLEFVASAHSLTVEQVIALHSGRDYPVYMLGFAPGFPYLGGLADELATPRRETPRVSVPAGSVAIGGRQTGVYPIATPAGWHIIGRTALKFYDVDASPPALLAAGDSVRFVPILG